MNIKYFTYRRVDCAYADVGKIHEPERKLCPPKNLELLI